MLRIDLAYRACSDILECVCSVVQYLSYTESLAMLENCNNHPHLKDEGLCLKPPFLWLHLSFLDSRLVELLTHEWTLTAKLRVPAVSRLQVCAMCSIRACSAAVRRCRDYIVDIFGLAVEDTTPNIQERKNFLHLFSTLSFLTCMQLFAFKLSVIARQVIHGFSGISIDYRPLCLLMSEFLL